MEEELQFTEEVVDQHLFLTVSYPTNFPLSTAHTLILAHMYYLYALFLLLYSSFFHATSKSFLGIFWQWDAGSLFIYFFFLPHLSDSHRCIY